ncbi:MAG: hypothetical protein WB615_01755 [Candidatus Tumulicola sp.]
MIIKKGALMHAAVSVLFVGSAAAALVGCNSGASRLAPSGSMQQSAVPLAAQRGAAIALHPDLGKSWLHPASQKLLYLSDYGTNDVYVYNYPSLTMAGTLTGFNGPQGECVDRKGDVYIANSAGENILEYAHGGSKPIKTLSDPGQYPVGCAVSTNGDLAVSNIYSVVAGPGSVAWYPGATGSPTIVYSKSFGRVYFLGYDKNGDLWLDGVNDSSVFQYGEIKHTNPTTIIAKTLSQPISVPGGVQWDGRHMAVGDQNGAAIYQVRPDGSTFGTTPLTGSGGVVQFFIEGSKVVGPDETNSNCEFFHYPAGGMVARMGPITLSIAVGSAISK